MRSGSQTRKLEAMRENLKLQFLAAPDERKLGFYHAWVGGWRVWGALVMTNVIAIGVSFGYLLAHPYANWPRVLCLLLVASLYVTRTTYEEMDAFRQWLRANLPPDYRPPT
jgi:hypothetical protein